MESMTLNGRPINCLDYIHLDAIDAVSPATWDTHIIYICIDPCIDSGMKLSSF